MDGLLLVDKPLGWTSFDVVNYVRKHVAAAVGKKPKNTKVGHTGTLDPAASGLLVLVIGSYCKRAQEFSKLDKTYVVTARLGQTSTTGDAEGTFTKVSDMQPDPSVITATCQHFTGVITQVPPAFSAIKVNGQRAYDLARQGKAVAIEPRQVTVTDITLINYTYPDVQLEVAVSSGTYIRTLVEDIGTKIGTGAYTAALRRTVVGKFAVTDAETPEQVVQHLADRLITQ